MSDFDSSSASVSEGSGSSTPSFDSVPDVSQSQSPPSEADTGSERSPSDTMGLDKPASSEQRQSYKFKSQGKEIELSDPAEIQRYLSMGYDANDKWQSAAEMKRQSEQFLRTLKNDPLAILNNPNLGLNVQELAMQILQGQIDDQLLSPEEKEFRSMKEQLEGFQREKSSREQAEAERRQVEADRNWEASTSQAVKEGLKSTGLPHTNFTWSTTLQYMAAAMDAGHSNVTPQDVMPYVKRDYQRAQEQLYSLPDDELLAHIGDANINRIQQAVIKKTRGGPAQGQARQAPQQQSSTGGSPGSVSEEQWIASVRENVSREFQRMQKSN